MNHLKHEFLANNILNISSYFTGNILYQLDQFREVLAIYSGHAVE
jgi:hypothetical protein